MGRIHLAVMLHDEPIGEIILKNIDRENQSCRLSIRLQNDSVKGRGYGTAAERLALNYAFTQLEMRTVFADALTKNTRSRYVLQKARFREIGNDGTSYYSCSKPESTPEDLK